MKELKNETIGDFQTILQFDTDFEEYRILLKENGKVLRDRTQTVTDESEAKNIYDSYLSGCKQEIRKKRVSDIWENVQKEICYGFNFQMILTELIARKDSRVAAIESFLEYCKSERERIKDKG